MTRCRGLEAALAASICILAVGCGLAAKRPQTQRYLLPAPKATVAIPAKMNIRLRGVTGIAPFQDTGIAYQTSAYKLDSYRYHRWVAPPTEMVADALNDVVKPPPAPPGGAGEEMMLLSARINSFQESRYAGKHDAVVAIEFCLTPDRPYAPCAWSRTVAHQTPVANDSPGAAVAALGAAYDQVMAEFAASLGGYLATRKPEVPPIPGITGGRPQGALKASPPF